MISEFRGFLTRTNALALAVGVIIGAAVGSVISSLVSDILMSIIGVFLPAGDWREARLVLESTTDAAGNITANAILYGRFLGTIIEFIIITAVVFLIVRTLVKPIPTPAVDPMRQCPECLEMVPAGAKRCRSCTMVIAAT